VVTDATDDIFGLNKIHQSLLRTSKSFMGNWLSYYILPAVGAILFLGLSLPQVDRFLYPYIPDIYYRIIAKGLIVLVVLFIIGLWLGPNPNGTQG